MRVWQSKDPDEVAIRHIDWSDHPSWIRGDAITSSSFSLTTVAGMTIDSQENDAATISLVTLSGGTANSRGKVLGEVVTSEGQTLQQTATIVVRER